MAMVEYIKQRKGGNGSITAQGIFKEVRYSQFYLFYDLILDCIN